MDRRVTCGIIIVGIAAIVSATISGGRPAAVASGFHDLAFRLKRSADTDGDGVLSAGELRSAVFAIVRSVAAKRPDADVNGDGITDRGDLRDAVRTYRSLLIAICGDAAVQAGEECDDGNLHDGDACSSRCELDANVPLEFQLIGRMPWTGSTVQNKKVLYAFDDLGSYRSIDLGRSRSTFGAAARDNYGDRIVDIAVDDADGIRITGNVMICVIEGRRFPCTQGGAAGYMQKRALPYAYRPWTGSWIEDSMVSGADVVNGVTHVERLFGRRWQVMRGELRSVEAGKPWGPTRFNAFDSPVSAAAELGGRLYTIAADGRTMFVYDGHGFSESAVTGITGTVRAMIGSGGALYVVAGEDLIGDGGLNYGTDSLFVRRVED